MARSKPSKQLSQVEIERFLVAAEALHLSIVKPLLSPMSEHYRALQNTHEGAIEVDPRDNRQGCAFHSV
ncbi:hypothetical protein NKI38_19315 [Mesorhizobium sp. M0621]|uniref:hypothetical protein n=1 Tax=Mesorhizobium sp. M0621 TaxID=2956974 RepID=UPI003337E9B8